MKYLVSMDGHDHLTEVHNRGGLVVSTVHGPSRRLDLLDADPLVSVLVEGKHLELEIRPHETGLLVVQGEVEHLVTVARGGQQQARAMRRGQSHAAEVKAPMPGLVVSVAVREGEYVAAGQGVAVLEAMKMQNELRTLVAGTVSKVFVQSGAVVERGQPLVRVE